MSVPFASLLKIGLLIGSCSSTSMFNVCSSVQVACPTMEYRFIKNICLSVGRCSSTSMFNVQRWKIGLLRISVYRLVVVHQHRCSMSVPFASSISSD